MILITVLEILNVNRIQIELISSKKGNASSFYFRINREVDKKMILQSLSPEILFSKVQSIRVDQYYNDGVIIEVEAKEGDPNESGTHESE